ERELARIRAAVARKRNPLQGKAEIGLAVGAVINRLKMAKHFALEIADASFAFARKTAEIATEAALDGLYAVRTSLPAAALDGAATVKSYKSLSLVERAIRSIKTVDLPVRPVYHWAGRPRARPTSKPQTRSAPASSPRPSVPPPPSPSRPPDALMTAFPSTASTPSLPTSPRSPETPSKPRSRPECPSPSPHARHPSRQRPSSSSALPVPSRDLARPELVSQDQYDASRERGKFRLGRESEGACSSRGAEPAKFWVSQSTHTRRVI